MNATPRLVVALLAIALTTAGAVANNKYTGREFPAFKAKDAVTGKPLELKSLRGKVVLIDFWATWCGPCIRELPNVHKTYKAYKDQGFEIVSVSLDSNRGKFERFVKSRKMNWPQVMEGGGWGTRLAKKYGINSIPAMYLIDHNGVCISDRARGPALERAVKAAVAKIPKKKAGAAKDPPRSPGVGTIPKRDDPDVDAGVDISDSRRVLVKIEEARQELAAAAAPVAVIGRRLVSVGNTINSIDRQMPDPKSASSLRRRYVAMWDELTAIRREMYVCGMLNEKIPPLPANPFDDPDQDQGRALTLAWGELPNARQAVTDLGLYVNVVSRQVHAAESKLDKIERRLARDAGSVTHAERAEALVNASRVTQQCRDGWETQLKLVDRELARYVGPESNELRSQVAALRASLDDEASDRTAARKRFTMICGKLLALGG